MPRIDRHHLKRSWRMRMEASRWQPVVRAGLDGVIAVEATGARLVDAARKRPTSPDVTSVTAVIKTFERPRQLRRLVASIRRLHPGLRVIVADDSRHPSDLPGVHTIRLPFNSGVSAGRRAAIERVETPYVVMLDDDFIFTRQSSLGPPLDVLDANPIIDVCGGRVINLPDFAVHDYTAEPLFPGAAPPLVAWGTVIDGTTVMAKVPNFYLGRTERLQLVGWSDELTFYDHRDFFTRASGVLVSVQHPTWSVLHARNPFDRASPERAANRAGSGVVISERYSRGR